jgi:hypothetical protein
VISRAFFLFFPCNHFINVYKKIFFRRSKRERICSLFVFTSQQDSTDTPSLSSLSPNRANSKPILPPCLPSRPPAPTQNLYSHIYIFLKDTSVYMHISTSTSPALNRRPYIHMSMYTHISASPALNPKPYIFPLLSMCIYISIYTHTQYKYMYYTYTYIYLNIYT